MYVVVRRYTGASQLIAAMVERQAEVKDLIKLGTRIRSLLRGQHRQRRRGDDHRLRRPGRDDSA